MITAGASSVDAPRQIRVLTTEDLARVLDTDELVSAMATAMIATSSGEVSMARRAVVDSPETKGVLVLTAAHRGGGDSLTAKLASCFFAGSWWCSMPAAESPRRSSTATC